MRRGAKNFHNGQMKTLSFKKHKNLCKTHTPTVQYMQKRAGNSMFFRLYFPGDGTMINVIKNARRSCLAEVAHFLFYREKDGGENHAGVP